MRLRNCGWARAAGGVRGAGGCDSAEILATIHSDANTVLEIIQQMGKRSRCAGQLLGVLRRKGVEMEAQMPEIEGGS
jgi:hypothetical protein